MGMHTNILTFHPFSLKKPGKLIRQVAECFKVNTYLVFDAYVSLEGYADSIENYPIENVSEHPSYLIDKFILDPELKNIPIYYNDYLYKWIMINKDRDIPPIKKFKESWKDGPGSLEEICDSFIDNPLLYDIYFDEGNQLELSVGAASLSNALFTSEWRSHYEIIMHHDFDVLDGFLKYRENLVTLAKQLGNDSMYFVPDHSHSKVGQGNFWDMTQDQVRKSLNNKTTQTHSIDLRKALLDWEYYYDLRHECEGDPNYFTLLVDDLKDINKTNVQKVWS